MKVPEKIYISNFDIEALPENEQLSEHWHEVSTQDTDIEYIRTDVFIEKLECWMNKNFYQYAGEFAEGILAQFDRTEDCVEDFKKYMKGE